MTTPISRRTVLRGMALGATAPVWVRFAEPAAAAAAAPAAATKRLLVVYLQGGNDPLQTLAPMGNAALLKMRPTVGLRDSELLNMGNGYGINKSVPDLFSFWKAGQLAAVQQVGPTVPNYSHTVALRRWETASPEDRFNSGWLGRYLDATPSKGLVRAVAFGDSLPLSLVGDRTDGLSMQSIDSFAFNDTNVADAAARRAALTTFAGAPAAAGSAREMLARSQRELLDVAAPIGKMRGTTIAGHAPTQADNAAQMFAAGLGTEIGFLTVATFDSHTDQRARHTTSVKLLNGVIKSFFSTATTLGVRDQSVMLIISEFGRRVYENKSAGTDHGEAGTVFVLGSGVKGGLYGPTFDASALDDGNLATRVDLRSVYASVLGGWLKTNPTPILGGTFPTIPLFR